MAPYSSEDCKAMLKAAIRDPNPVVFLENEILYGKAFEVSDEVMDKNYVAEIGKVGNLKYLASSTFIKGEDRKGRN